MSPTVDASCGAHAAVNERHHLMESSSEESTIRPVSPLAPLTSRCLTGRTFSSTILTCNAPDKESERPLALVSRNHRSGESNSNGSSTTSSTVSRNHSNADRTKLYKTRELLAYDSHENENNFRRARLFKAGYFHGNENNSLDDYDFDVGSDYASSGETKGSKECQKSRGFLNTCFSYHNSGVSNVGCSDILDTFASKSTICLNLANNSSLSDTDENSTYEHNSQHGDAAGGKEQTISPTYYTSRKSQRLRKSSTRHPNHKETNQASGVNDHTIIDDAITEEQQNNADIELETSSAMTAASGAPSTIYMNGNIEEAESTSQGSPKKQKRTSDPNHVSHQFFHLEPCLYTHRMFQRAATIFSVLKHDDADTEEKKALRRRNGEAPTVKAKIPDMDFMDSQEQIKTFELTFATLKFQKLFSAILDYIGFFYKYSNLNDHYSLVYVILHDLQTRRFQRRTTFPDEILDEVCSEVEEALLCEKTKLQANIAKERIKHNAPTVDFLLPEHVRNKDETKAKTPVYMWVNQMKTTVDNMVANLKADKFQLMDAGTDMSEILDQSFVIDPHCSDVLTFPPHMSMELKASEMVKSGFLVQQDKSSCLAPQTVTHLLGNDHDVIHVNIGTAMSTCHLASLLRHKSPQSNIWAFGVNNPQKASKVMQTMEFLEVKNVKIVLEDFLNIDPEESKYKGVRIILISANCSKSAITSPVQFIVSEGEDTQILGELSVGEADMNHVRDLMVDHERLLKHALKFPKLQAVVYTTRSRFELENEQVVSKVLDIMNMTNTKHNHFKIAPPVLPFNVDEINTGKGGVDGRYLRFLPSDKANGCFVAIIAREPEETKESKASSDKKKSKLNKSRSSQFAPKGSSGSQKHRISPKVSVSESSGNGTEELEVEDEGVSNDHKPKTPTTASKKSHKHAAAPGARLYQQGVIKKMEKARPTKPEHLKVIKHPAPFR